MKKNLKKLFLLTAVVVTAMVCLAFSVGAVTGQCGENVYYDYDSSTGEFTIYGEGSIDDWWDVHNVENWKDIQSVIIENGVISLGKSNPAFSGCQKLKEVKLPEGITLLPNGFFSRCTILEKIIIPKSCNTISMEVFMDCTSLTNILIPKNVTQIGMHAFWGCTNLKFIAIESETLVIRDFAFNGCSGLIDVYYSGTEEQWNKIEIGKYNDELLNANIHFNHKHIDFTSDGLCDNCTAKVGAAHTHTPKTTTTKATLKKNGKQVTKCTVCGNVSKTTTVYYPKSIKLSATSYTYNGKTKTPSVVIKDSKGKTLKKDTDYTVKYASGRKNPGKYTVTVTFKGKYSGTKKLSFTIKPATVTISKVTAGSKQLTANWKTVSAVTGYEVQASTSSKFTSKTTKKVTLKSAKTKKTTIKKLKKGKKYYVKVRAYKTVDGKKIYGGWSKVKTVKVK